MASQESSGGKWNRKWKLTNSILQVIDISKNFPGVKALDKVSLTLSPGETLAVIGENGAGKSTLMKILAGEQQPDSGTILLDGAAVQIDSVRTAAEKGIALIHQELNLAENLDIAANIFLGHEARQMGVLLNRQSMNVETEELLKRIGLDRSPKMVVESLSPGEKQMVEIAKALRSDARILIMDEPSSSLSQHETDRLYELIADLKQHGVSVIYISHRLGEVSRVADRVVALRDGKNAGELPKEGITHGAMVKLMVGRELGEIFPARVHEGEKPMLEVRDFEVAGGRPVSFAVRAGEIVGLAGLVGAGRTELVRGLFGVDPVRCGEIRIDGKPVQVRSPKDAIRSGIALVPEDRKLQGLILEMAVRENLTMAGLDHYETALLIDRKKERESCKGIVEKYGIRTPSLDQQVQYLSGGNQQKVVLAKWLSLSPKVLLLDEPTRGVDVGAKQEIYRLIEQLADQGVATLMISSEMQEILGMSDRILVMWNRGLAGELSRAEATEEAVMFLATGKEAA